MKDQRGQAKAERAFLARQDVQQCVVCGRLFCRRRDNVCSVSCLAELEKKKANASQ
jgi:hypothetical protein